MPAEIFISYARVDRDRIEPLLDSLRAINVSFWVDEGNIHAATLWSEEIVDAINACTVMVVILSDNSTTSDNVVKEVMLASELKKPILPVYLEETEVPRKLQYQLAGIQHLELHGRDISNLSAELAKSLNRMGVQTSDSVPIAASHPNITRAKRRFKLSKKTKSTVKTICLCLFAFTIGLLITKRTVETTGEKPAQPNDTPFHVTERIGENLLITTNVDSPIAISPDGEHVAVIVKDGSRQTLYLRESKTGKWQGITEANKPANPTFSPDSQWLFFSSNVKALKSYSLADGTIQTAVPDINAIGLTFGDDLLIYPKHYRTGLYLFNTVSRDEIELTTPSSEALGHFWPHMLPDGKHFLYTDFIPGLKKTTVRLCAVDGSQDEVLIQNAFTAKYATSGHVLFVRDGNLMAVKFDKEQNKISGSSTPILNDLYVEAGIGRGGYSISQNGILVYAKESEVERLSNFSWIDRDGNEEALTLENKTYGSFSLSRDETQLALTIQEANNQDIWVHDFNTGVRTRLTDKTTIQMHPQWVGDHQSILYVNDVPPYALFRYDLRQKQHEPILVEQYDVYKPTVSADGRFVAYSQIIPAHLDDLFVLDLESGNKTTPISTTVYNETTGAISPNGKYIAYQSDLNGKNQIYVVEIANPKNTKQVSVAGGEESTWSRDGTELFFRNETSLISVKFDPETGQVKSTPSVIFTKEFARFQSFHSYQPSKDGKRFLILKEAGESTANRVHFIFNLDEILKQKLK